HRGSKTAKLIDEREHQPTDATEGEGEQIEGLAELSNVVPAAEYSRGQKSPKEPKDELFYRAGDVEQEQDERGPCTIEADPKHQLLIKSSPERHDGPSQSRPHPGGLARGLHRRRERRCGVH